MRGKSLMQFKYCRQLLSKTNDKYYLINVLYVYGCVWRLTIGIEQWQVEKRNSICLHNGWDSRKLPLVFLIYLTVKRIMIRIIYLYNLQKEGFSKLTDRKIFVFVYRPTSFFFVKNISNIKQKINHYNLFDKCECS
jgi:hypothetical protein